LFNWKDDLIVFIYFPDCEESAGQSNVDSVWQRCLFLLSNAEDFFQ